MLEPRWIPVQERLPDDDSIVLVADADGLFMGNYDHKANGWWVIGLAPAAGVEITHWRPLPALPRTAH